MMTIQQVEDIMIDDAVKMNLDLTYFACKNDEHGVENLEDTRAYRFGRKKQSAAAVLFVSAKIITLSIHNEFQGIGITIYPHYKNQTELLTNWLADTLSMHLTHDKDGWFTESHIEEIFDVHHLHRAEVPCSEMHTLRQLPDDDQMLLFPIAGLDDYYYILPMEKTIKVTLSRDELATIFQAYDYGVNACDSEGKRFLEHALCELKNAIHP